MGKTEVKDIYKVITDDLSRINKKLKNFLELCGVEVEKESFIHMLESLEKLNVMRKGLKHVGFVLDENGYIVKIFRVDDFMPYKNREDIPKDVAHGYYKLVDGELVRDPARERQIRSVI